jgi:ribosomal protein S18 acetylase RimI-like enzyme
MTAPEYDDWRPRCRDGYANDMIENGGLRPEQAWSKADTDFARLLPDGLETDGQLLYTIEEDGEAVGDLWLAERDQDNGRTLFVYDVSVREDRRGRGLGRVAMLFAEEEARRRGLADVSLNVFGGNTVARSLYRSLGYREAAVWMSKAV